jgi:hypothetical protein
MQETTMNRSHRHPIAVLACAAALGLCAAGAAAQDLPKPLVVYDATLANGWQSWSWAKVQLSAPVGSDRPIKVEGEPWSALALHHDAFSTAGYSKLTFYINGGTAGGQSLMVKAQVDGKPIEADYVIRPKAKTWAVVEVPLKDLNAADRTIDTIMWQAQGNAYAPYYIARIQFE